VKSVPLCDLVALTKREKEEMDASIPIATDLTV